MYYGSSPPKSIFKSAESSEADLKMDLGGLELKLHKVHFAVKFSKGEAHPRLRSKWFNHI